MFNKKQQHTNNSSSSLKKGVIAILLLIFIHFTFGIQYINWNNFGLSLTEIVEEEEKEEHKQDLLEVLVNNTSVILYLTVKIKEPILEPIITEVSTPPPELS
ncbi:MAG: hypothetical protein J5I47_11475 [Vicingus serpentipes]|nr:hypothetical protein [Vicingus serpentipes]